MPYSYSLYKDEIAAMLKGEIEPLDRVLDVGAGAGTYARLLPTIKMDCLEIHQPYVKRFHLGQFYQKIHIGDIRTFDFDYYTYLIMGDVLEHLTFAEARAVLDRAALHRVMVAVPYRFEQGEWEGNAFETHHQPDLTPELMKQRYPELKLQFGDDNYGYYTNY